MERRRSKFLFKSDELSMNGRPDIDAHDSLFGAFVLTHSPLTIHHSPFTKTHLQAKKTPGLYL